VIIVKNKKIHVISYKKRHLVDNVDEVFFMQIRKRAIYVISAILIVLTFLIGRLVQLQLISTESFTDKRINLIAESVSQRTQEYIIDKGRGRFIDRNGQPLTHDYSPNLVLFPFLKYMNWPVDRVAAILNIPTHVLEDALKDAEKPIIFGEDEPFRLTEYQMEQINKLKIPGVFAVNRQYHVNEAVAEHLIGIIGYNKKLLRERYENKSIPEKTMVGITGLQATFDEFLLPDGETKLLYHVDGSGNPLFGLEVRYTAPANPFYPVEVKTTIDKDFQQLAENIIKKHRLTKGGLVLLDIQSNDVLAMVSAPSINKRNPYHNGTVINRTLIPSFPGSVFKTVIAAAAIEKNLVSSNRKFDCSLNLYGKKDEKHDLGMLNFEESFAQSCNYTFALLAKELMKTDPDIIEKYAEKLGLTNLAGWRGDVYHMTDFRQFPEEKSGQIWGDESDKRVPKAIAQTAIGQKNVKVTPLAMANMMATIARGGEKQQVRAVSEVLYKNGSTLFSFPKKSIEGDTISPYTAGKLQQLLREVVENEKGTGRRFQSLPYEVAGKSGTAETIKGDPNRKPLVNRWFAGYFPAGQPKYALVVVELDKESSKTVTNDVFYDMVQGIYDLENQQQ
jgi:penicillin-binding protein 4B